MRITLLFAVLVGFYTPRTSAAELEVGVAVEDVTPPLGYRMSGYFRERLNTGTHDPLQAKAIVLRQGEAHAAMVFCDMVGISLNASRRARAMAAKSTNIPFNSILINATHSHTGPLYFGALREEFHERTIKEHGKDIREAVDYEAFLVKQLVSAIQKAKQTLTPVDVFSGTATERTISFNRRFHMKEGPVRFNPGRQNPNIIKPAGPIDPEVGLVLFKSKETKKAVAMLTVFALHLDTVGGSEYSADFPFHLERSLQQLLGNQCVSIFGIGTCGDINHIDVKKPQQLKGQAEASRIAAQLADTVQTTIPKLKLVTPQLAMKSSRVTVPLQKYSAEEIKQAKANMAKIGTRDLTFLEQVEAYKITALQLRDGNSITLETQVLQLSEELALVGLPGEVFVDLGLAIKKASPFAQTFVIELCNDAPGYLPTKKAFAEGSYETVNSRIAPGGAETLIEQSIELLKQLNAED